LEAGMTVPGATKRWSEAPLGTCSCCQMIKIASVAATRALGGGHSASSR